MSTNGSVIITEEENKLVSDFYQIFKKAPTQVTQDMRMKLVNLTDKAWIIAKNRELTKENRNKAYDFLKITHEILGRKFDDNWRPKESATGGKSWTASKEQRKQNCEEFKAYIGLNSWNMLSGYEQALILARIWGTIKQ